MPHKHREAFCLMKYMTDDKTEKEFLWNSRDGVTPFVIHSATSGKKMMHVEWQNDLYAPNHRPKAGDRIFVDCLPEHIRDQAVAYVEKHWDAEDLDGLGLQMKSHPFFEGHDKQWAAEHFIQDWTKPGSPHILVVA